MHQRTPPEVGSRGLIFLPIQEFPERRECYFPFAVLSARGGVLNNSCFIIIKGLVKSSFVERGGGAAYLQGALGPQS